MKNIFDVENKLSTALSDSLLKWGIKQEENPLVSIVIPVYNRFDFFKKALDSALKQNCSIPYSIIITDNNYDNDIDNVNAYEKYIAEINSPQILYYKNKLNLGPIGNFNRGIQLCQSEYFVMCHEDDELCEDCLNKLWTFKSEHHIKKEIVFSSSYRIDDNSVLRNDFAKNDIVKKNLKRVLLKEYCHVGLLDWFMACQSNGCGALINRNALLDLGGYDEQYRPAADYALFTLYSYTYGAYRFREKLYKYRIGDTNYSKSVFYKIVEREKFYCDCIKERIWWAPNFILDQICKARQATKMEADERIWLKNVEHPASKMDKIIIRVVGLINSMKHCIW